MTCVLSHFIILKCMYRRLVKQPITKVPERYVHPNQDPVAVSNTNSLPQVPVIDLHKLLSDDAT